MAVQPGDEESKPDTGEQSTGEPADNPSGTVAKTIMESNDLTTPSEKSEANNAADNAAKNMAEKTASESGVSDKKANEEPKHPRHQAQIFNELLEKTAPDVKADGPTYRHPVIIDGLLAVGLLVAMAGFTLGAVKIYIVHEARHDITDRRYTEAIAILKSAPLPGLFSVNGESPEDLLDQAHYLDAIEKLDADKGDQTALRELDAIRPGSRFFDMANNIKDEHAPISPIKIKGDVEHQATPAEVKGAERPFPAPPSSD
jgi:hypothetical protein